jgi:hypothetical protein
MPLQHETLSSLKFFMLTTKVFCLVFRTQRESPTNTTTNIPLRLYYKLQGISLPRKSTSRRSEQKSNIPNFHFVISGQQILANYATQATTLRSVTSPQAQIAPAEAVTIDPGYAKLSSPNIKNLNSIISCIVQCVEKLKFTVEYLRRNIKK